MNIGLIVKALIIVGAIVCIWRGIWGLLDIYLLPDDPSLSFSISIVIGIILIFIVSGKRFLSFLV